MEERRPRERELVLAPNEYAYILDTTKGHINCYVGPNKTSLAQTDQPVVFNERTKKFEPVVETPNAVQLFATAPAGFYMVLKNPAKDGAHPKPGLASASVDLDVGKKVVLHGPRSFALWPGQMARVVMGHRLRTNQYLVIHIYDAALANTDAAAVLGYPRSTTPTTTTPTTTTSTTTTMARFEAGEKRIIKGTEVAWYLPPNGVEVLADAQGNYVREAVTLQRLEYCVLVGEDGKKKYVRGEAVVFPSPEQRFVEENGERRFRAIELSEITGLHVKVTAPYVDDDGAQRTEGEELFITGKNRIYFPRDEHAIVKSGPSEVHHAIAIPAGEGRYVLNRLTGEIALKLGPVMFLPDPRREVITRRILTDRECALLYPSNDDALSWNRALRRGSMPAPKREPNANETAPASPSTKQKEGVDGFARGAFVAPRTITLDAKYDGAVSVDVWPGYAVQVVDKTLGRRVMRGPATVLLEWDETLAALSLSTGTPKSSAKLLSTAFLQITGNQVSDIVEVVSQDLVRAAVMLKYRVSFEGEAGHERWFDVDNYVKLLCDHASSLIKAAARANPIRKLRTDVADVVRDAVLGKKPADGVRAGLRFDENGMRVVDVEVLDLEIVDDEVRALVDEAQLASIKSAIAVSEREVALSDRKRVEEIERALLREEHATKALALELLSENEKANASLAEQRELQRAQLALKKREAELDDAERELLVRTKKLETKAAETAAALDERARKQALDVDMLRAQVDAAVKQGAAFAPDLIAAVTRLGDAQLLSALAENFGELAAVEGRGLLETARKFLDFVPQSALPALQAPKLAEREGDAE